VKTLSKAELRRRATEARDGIDDEVRREKNQALRERLLALDEYAASTTVLFYVSFRTEVDTLRAIRLSLEGGKTVVLPKVDPRRRELDLFRIESLNDLISGYRGIPEPGLTKNRETKPEDVDLVVLPGLAFDRTGNRIGYGGGYYDRLLARSRPDMPRIALAYDEQIFERIDAEAHDQRVSVIVTDRETIRCR